ncbi:MAG: diaminopimelate decarboxylase [Rikenellaceae bacterium]|nr:diaminopimelate decarboxylase [Rikenellaceae bacterium]
MGSKKYIEKLKQLPTPFYFYDMELLKETLQTVTSEAGKYGFDVHYAVKANYSDRIMEEINKFGLGTDCVSGGEVRRSVECGIPASKIVFAGVAKSDEEIKYALKNDIFSFNCESREELEIINKIAGEMGKTATVALRINPDVDPKTHKNISTGKAENKFGISYSEIEEVIGEISALRNINIIGIHFHIGSQIRDLSVFKKLCDRVNTLQEWFIDQGFNLKHINVGGGLGINYDEPDAEPIPDFKTYFKIFSDNLKLAEGQTLHFELGRSIVGQCGELITKVLYTKVNGEGTEIALVDAGMTDLIRPAMYQAKHKTVNLTSDSGKCKNYMVAGPICESTDVFGKSIELPETKRGDLLTMKSAGAYGRCMSFGYNLRELPKEYFSDEL